MKQLNIFITDEDLTRQLLKAYRSSGKEERKLDVYCYKKIRFKGYSVEELSKKVYLSHSATYRRFRKVDSYIREQVKSMEQVKNEEKIDHATREHKRE